MSHYTRVKTRIRDRNGLVLALNDVGFRQVEVHDHAQHLYGYQGDVRADLAEVIVRREYVGPAANDLGFKLQPDGEYRAIISEYDRGTRLNAAWLASLHQRYAYNTVRAYAEERDYVVVEEPGEVEGEIVFILAERG